MLLFPLLLYCEVILIVTPRTVLVSSYICAISSVNIAIAIQTIIPKVFCFFVRVDFSFSTPFLIFFSKLFCCLPSIDKFTSYYGTYDDRPNPKWRIFQLIILRLLNYNQISSLTLPYSWDSFYVEDTSEL